MRNALWGGVARLTAACEKSEGIPGGTGSSAAGSQAAIPAPVAAEPAAAPALVAPAAPADLPKRSAPSTAEVLKKFDLFCEDGVKSACFDAGMRRALGKGTPRDRPAGVVWLEKGCTVDDPESCNMLAGFLFLGDEGVPIAMKRALDLQTCLLAMVLGGCGKSKAPSCDAYDAGVGRSRRSHVRSPKSWHSREMRLAGLLALSVLAMACGDRSTKKESHVITTLADKRFTPVWIGVSAGKLLVGLAKDVDQYGLVEVDLANGNMRDIAGALPMGAFALSDGHLYLAEFMGAVGEVELSSGAYERIAKFDQSPTTLAVSGDRFLLGTPGHVLVVERSGTASELPGSALAGSESLASSITTPAGIFVTAAIAGKVFRIDGGQAKVIADKQQSPHQIASTKTDLVWTIGEGSTPNRHLIAAPHQGGAARTIASVPEGAHIQTLAANDTTIVYAQSDGNGAGLYALKPGEPAKLIATGKPTRVIVDGAKVIWIDLAKDQSYQVQSASL